MNRIHSIISLGQEWYERLYERYLSLSFKAKLSLWIYFALHLVAIFTFWYIGWENIFAWLAHLADQIRQLQLGWLILSLIVIVTSIPPLIGYGTAQTLIGFAYGVTPGFYISAGSCIVGGCFAFLVVRKLVRFFAPFLQRDETFQALSSAVAVKGLPLIILLRLCPFPYPYSNAFFASVESVTLWQFFLATLTITPKLLLHVFIGHRTYLFADPESRHKMDPTSRWINLTFMVVGSVLGAATSWYLYKLTMQYVEEANERRLGGGGDEELNLGLEDDETELDDDDSDDQRRLGRGGARSRRRSDEDLEQGVLLRDVDRLLSLDDHEEEGGGDGIERGKGKAAEGRVEGGGIRKKIEEAKLVDVSPEDNSEVTRVEGGRIRGGGEGTTDHHTRKMSFVSSSWGGEDGGGGISDFDDDDDQVNNASNRQYEQNGGGRGGDIRRDSVAWGLDDDDFGNDDVNDERSREGQDPLTGQTPLVPVQMMKKRID